MKIKLLSVILLVFLCENASFAQCTFANQPFNATVQSICYNTEVISPNVGEVATIGVTVGSYVAVNVVKGYTYAIKTTAADLGFIKRVTLFDSTATGVSLATAAATTNTTAISLPWIASFTGTLYVQFNNNSNGCASSSSADTITISYTGGNNISDSQTTFGIDSWVGHVYNFSNAVAAPPTDANVFGINGNYLGYFNVATQNFNQSYGGTDTCFPYTANGVSATLRTDTFAVKYRMQSTLTGCYLVNVRGDDGVRLTVDGVKVFDKWMQQSATTYDNVLVYLNGHSDLLFEYYEKNGGNDSNFTMTPFPVNANAVTAPTPSSVCSGVTPGLIDGTSFVFNGASVNPTINFQWQSSSDNSSWTNITGATSEDYSPAAITTTTTNVTVYYRRVVSATAATASACVYNSNSIAITTSPIGSVTVPITNAGSGLSCSQVTANWSASTNASSYLLDVATDSGFTSILPLYTNLNVGNVTSFGITNLAPGVTYYYRVRAMNGCNTTTNSGTISFATLAFVPTSSAGTHKFSIDSPSTNILVTSTVNSGQYISLDVVQGFSYTFSVGDVFSGLNESLNILDATTGNNVSPTAFSTAVAGTSITWTATFSGQIQVVLTSNDCSNTGATGGTLQLKLNSVGNTLDSQTAFGTNTWVGHVYNWTGGSPPGGTTSPAVVSPTNPFTAANYVGYYIQGTEAFSQSFVGAPIPTNFSVLSNGVSRTDIYTEQFAVRYRMKSTQPAGCYIATMNADDGLRLYVDGVLVFDAWKDQGNSVYGSVLIHLTGNSDLVFDYYENGGGNTVGFSLAPFVSSANAITAPNPSLVCSATVPGAIIGTFTYNGATVNPTINFQWQSSSDNVTWTDIPGGTLQNYTPVAVTTTTANVTVYYRRIVVGSSATTSGCSYTSNVISITTSPGIAAVPVSPFGSGAACTQITSNWSASVDATSYRLDVSTVNTFASFVGIYNNLNVGNVATYNVTGLTAGATYYFRVRAVNGCGASSSSVTATFSTLSATPATPGTITGTTPQCPSLTGQVYSIAAVTNATAYNWTVPTGWSITAGAGFTSITVTTGATGAGGNISVTATNSCGTSGVRNFAVTVVSTSSIGGTLNGSTTACAGLNSTLLTLTGYTGTIQRWESSTDNFASAVTLIANTATTYTVTNLNTTTQYRAVVKNGTNCAVNSSLGTVTITPSLTVASITPNSPQFLCGIGTGTLLTASETGGGTITRQWGKRSVSSGAITAIVGQTSPTYTPTGTDLASGTWFLVCTSTPTCGSVVISNEVQVVVNAMPIAPVLNNVVLTCNQTMANGTWAAVPNISNYRFDVSLDPLFGSFIPGYQDILVAPSLNPTESVAVNGLTPGVTYYARARTISSCGTPSLNSNTATLSVPITTTTDGGLTWDNFSPDSTKKAVYAVGSASSVTMVTPINACSVQINPGVNVIVGTPGNANTNAVLHIENGLTVDATSTLTFENNASLIQVNDVAVNSGLITYKRITTPMKNFDFTDWSSPVLGQTLKKLSPNTLSDKYYSFWDRVWITENSATAMSPGKGYTIRTPKEGVWGAPYPETVVFPYAQPVSFIGKPNNGVYTVTVNSNAGRYNFIGNPYPSALDADVFVPDNAAAIKGTIYIWTHNTPITQSGSNYVYSQDDYAAYNAFLGAGVAAASSTIPGANTNEPTGKVASGQGFFTISTTGTTGSVTFNNNMRVGAAASNSQFFKGTKTKKSTIERHRIWLSLSNTQGAFKQTLIGYATGATNGDDIAFDGSNYTKNAYIDFYSLISTKKCVIQGRALPFDKKDEVPLGYKSTIDGSFSISIDKIDGVLASQDVFLQDKTASVYYNLKKGPYTFNTLKGTFDDRFVLVYVDKLAVVVPPVVVEPPVVVTPPVVVEPPVVVVPPVVVTPPVVVEPPVVVVPPVVVTPPVVVEPPVVVVPPVVVEPPVVVTPPVVVVPPVVVDPPVVVTPPVVVDPPIVIPPVVVLDPTLENPEYNKTGKAVVVSVNNHQIKINSFDETISKVMVYDLTGRLLFENENINKNEYLIQNLNSSDQFLIVITQLVNGKWVTKEIVF